MFPVPVSVSGLLHLCPRMDKRGLFQDAMEAGDSSRYTGTETETETGTTGTETETGTGTTGTETETETEKIMHELWIPSGETSRNNCQFRASRVLNKYGL